MTDNEELHVVFGTGAVGMAVMDELIRRGRRRVRMVNRSGRARVPDGVEVVGGDAHGHPATHGSSIAYFAVLVGLLGLFLGLLSKRTPLRVRLGMPWTKALRRAPYASHPPPTSMRPQLQVFRL